MTWFVGIYRNPRNFFVQFAVDVESHLRLYPELGLTDEERRRWLANQTGAVVGRETAERFGWSVDDRVALRASELAVLKTLGFTNGRVLALVLLEAGLLAVVGGSAGLGMVSLILSGGDPTGGVLPEFAIPPRGLAIGAGLVIASGAISAAWPGLQATRLRIVDGLGR